MIKVFTGDPFLARQALLEEARLQGLKGFTPPEPEALAQALQGGLFGRGGAAVDLSEAGEAAWKAIKPLLERVPQEVPLLILDPRPSPARAAFYRGLERLDFPTPKGKDLVRYIENRARALGLKLPSGVAHFLAGLMAEGPDLMALEQELQKLRLLTPPLTLEKVEKVVALRPPMSGFEVVRLVLEGKGEEALRRLNALLSEGEDPLRVLGAFSWQYALLFRARALLEAGGLSLEEQAARLEAHPFAARRALEVARRLRMEELEQALDLLLEAELRAKRGRDARLALEKLVVELTGASSLR
ncbi:DNA polymerase III subunit delta [Thermus filiformis]|uniref:DNA-directed DNA polymerase n=1 Tax=Thermus filiformis TaxID=276 RepID=A0A0A2WNS2_THEFI|nr:DNA polymerase III subunit delta [Thermus filiformis]KGQ21473.1 DNA polymerase III subunit delta [Thermus filiformis]